MDLFTLALCGDDSGHFVLPNGSRIALHRNHDQASLASLERACWDEWAKHLLRKGEAA